MQLWFSSIVCCMLHPPEHPGTEATAPAGKPPHEIRHLQIDGSTVNLSEDQHTKLIEIDNALTDAQALLSVLQQRTGKTPRSRTLMAKLIANPWCPVP